MVDQPVQGPVCFPITTRALFGGRHQYSSCGLRSATAPTPRTGFSTSPHSHLYPANGLTDSLRTISPLPIAVQSPPLSLTWNTYDLITDATRWVFCLPRTTRFVTSFNEWSALSFNLVRVVSNGSQWLTERTTSPRT